mgnify:CR=1 FL=1
MQSAIILGPAVGGFVYLAGPSAVYGTGAVLFVASVVLLGLISRRPPAPATARRAELKMWRAVDGLLRLEAVVLGAISLDLFAVLLGGVTAMLPIIAKDLLQTGPTGLGFLRSAPAVGALLVSFWLARRPIERQAGKIMFAGVAVFANQRGSAPTLATRPLPERVRGLLGGILEYSDVFFGNRLGVVLNISESNQYALQQRVTTNYNTAFTPTDTRPFVFASNGFV